MVTETPAEWKARIGVGRPCTAIRHLDSGPGTARTRPVPNGDAPGQAGTRTDHWDGRADAVARAHVTPTPLARRTLTEASSR